MAVIGLLGRVDGELKEGVAARPLGLKRARQTTTTGRFDCSEAFVGGSSPVDQLCSGTTMPIVRFGTDKFCFLLPCSGSLISRRKL